MANILLASLGESPVVVPVMYHLLKEQKSIEFDRVQVLAPEGRWVPLSYDLVEEALQPEQAPEKISLPFEDANTERECLQFLQILAQTLKHHQQEKNIVYLSLAGGRKSMAALMAWIVPFFPCIQGLYHVIDPEKEQFPSVKEIVEYSPAKRKLLMHPSKETLDTLKLVPIPFMQEQLMDYETFAHHQALDDERLETLQDDTIAAITMYQQVMDKEKLLDVQVTQMAADQYTDLYKNDANRAYSARVQYFQKMRTAAGVRALFHPLTNDVYDRSGPGTPHYSKSMRTMVRPVFYTIPNTRPQGDEKLTKVVVCAVETKDNKGNYRPLVDVTSDPKFSWDPVGSIDTLPLMTEDPDKEHILLVPLGMRPMIATQLYTLLTEEDISIQQIVLFYPGLNRTIHYGIELLERAIREEKRRSGKNIKLRRAAIPNRSDIDSTDACIDYQQKLEKEIQSIQDSAPNKRVLLSLSGGRKGMTAMTISAARNLGLPYVYHTLIMNEELSDTIDQETTISVLNDPKITRTERNDRLFLRSYDRSQFHLFRVPVLTKEQFAVS
jgi:CRISPR-associated Csx14 family protein